MRKHIAWIGLFLAILIPLVFFYSWSEFVGYSLIQLFSTWNIHAFLNKKNMFSPPRMSVNVKKDGNQEDRGFLFVFSCLIFIFICVGWIYRSTSI
jgi:hypothetical protein